MSAENPKDPRPATGWMYVVSEEASAYFQNLMDDPYNGKCMVVNRATFNILRDGVMIVPITVVPDDGKVRYEPVSH